MKRTVMLLLACLLALTVVTASDDDPPATAKLHVPDGFVVEQVAAAPDVVFPMFAVFDDCGRLFVAESSGLDLYAEVSALTRKCRIRLLEDPDAKGHFTTSHVFADQLVFPMGLAWRDGKLYVADPPDLVALEDTDGDGKADRRTVILSGFGHRDNGSLHGLTFGPDGLLYMTCGHPDGYKLKLPDGSILQGESGALLRCRPDGTDVEVLCRGFENLVEVVFTPRGEIIGTDNWFQKPSGGFRDALVHLVPGGLYPLHRDVGTPQPITGEPLPPISLFPAVALSGLTLYRGTAFPQEMQGNLFSAQHNARKVQRHVVVPEGSTFRTENHDFVTSDDPDFHPSDVLEDANGTLFVIDTGSWYIHHCPTGQIRKSPATGGIYKVTRGSRVLDPLDLHDLKKDADETLAGLLGDSRAVIRDRAQQILTARGKTAVAALAAILRDPDRVTAKQHAVWALAGITDESALAPLRKSLTDASPDVVAPAARALGLRRDREAAPELGRLLGADAVPVRLAAAEAIARCGEARSLPALWQALAAQPDRFLEHALTHAVHQIATTEDLQEALKNPSPRVQKTALVLLDQPPRPRRALGHEAVLARVTAEDAELRQAALRLLQEHPEWAEHALGLLRGWLEKPELSGEEQAGLRGLLLAFQGQRAVQEMTAAVVAGQGGKEADRRVLVLQTLGECSLAPLPTSWIDALGQALQDRNPAVRAQAVKTAAVLQVPQLDDALVQLADNKEEPDGVRLEALRAVVLRKPGLSAAADELLLGQLAEEEKPFARLAVAEVLGRAHLTEAQALRVLAAVKGETLISPAVLLPALERAAGAESGPALLDYLADALRNGWKPNEQEWQRVLDGLPAAVQAKAGPVRELWRQSGERQKARLAELEPLLAGGKPERGRAIFFGKKVGCAVCHRVGAEGGQVGPDLTKIGAVRSGRDILEAVIAPSASIAQGYDNYAVSTRDGRVATGVLARQTADALFLRDSSGGELRFRKDQVTELRRLPTSLMPEGLDRLLAPEEFRDLLGFLQSLK
jgi:putative heme-binding domain-containing protein